MIASSAGSGEDPAARRGTAASATGLRAGLPQPIDVAVGGQAADRGRRAEHGAGDAVVAAPAAVLVLHLGEAFAHLRHPLAPLLAAVDRERLALHLVAEELLAAVVAETVEH